MVWNAFPACTCATARQRIPPRPGILMFFRRDLSVCLPASSPTPLLSLAVGKGRQSWGGRDRSRDRASVPSIAAPQSTCVLSVPGIRAGTGWAPRLSSALSSHQGLHRRWGWAGIIPRAAGALVPHLWGCLCVSIHIPVCVLLHILCACIHTHTCVSVLWCSQRQFGILFPGQTWKKNRDRPFLTTESLSNYGNKQLQ